MQAYNLKEGSTRDPQERHKLICESPATYMSFNSNNQTSPPLKARQSQISSPSIATKRTKFIPPDNPQTQNLKKRRRKINKTN